MNPTFDDRQPSPPDRHLPFGDVAFGDVAHGDVALADEASVDDRLTGIPAANGEAERVVDGVEPIGDEPAEPEPAPAARRLQPLSLVALGLVVAGGRWWFSSNRTMFHMAPDEPAQLAMARWISGGARWNLFDHSSWRPGMATLLAPVFWFTDDPATIVHSALAIGAALGGIAAVQLALLGQRLTNLSATGCLLAAGVIALAPSSLSATSFVWAEGLVTVTFLASLAAVLRFYDTDRTRHGLAAVLAAVAGFTSHSRLLPMVAIVVALVVGRSLRHRAWRRAATLTGVAVAATGASFAYANWVFSHVWDDPASSNTVGTVVKRLPNVTDNLESALGQMWYQLVATAGLALVGLAALAVAGLRRAPRARDARLVLAMTLPLVVVSMIFMSGRTRSDHRIYGRYNDAVLWPVLIVAIAWIVGLHLHRRRTVAIAGVLVTAAATVASGFGVHQAHGDALAASVGVRPMVAGFMPVMGTRGQVPIVVLTAVGAAAVVVLAGIGLTRFGRPLLAVVALAFVVGGAWRTHDALNMRLNSWSPALQVAAIDQLVPPDATIGFRFVREEDKPTASWDEQRRRAQLYQFALPDHPFLRDRGLDDAVGPYVFAPVDNPELERAGARVLWVDPKVKIALWEEPSTP